jgi:hypothetical protein
VILNEIIHEKVESLANAIEHHRNQTQRKYSIEAEE